MEERVQMEGARGGASAAGAGAGYAGYTGTDVAEVGGDGASSDSLNQLDNWLHGASMLTGRSVTCNPICVPAPEQQQKLAGQQPYLGDQEDQEWGEGMMDWLDHAGGSAKSQRGVSDMALDEDVMKLLNGVPKPQHLQGPTSSFGEGGASAYGAGAGGPNSTVHAVAPPLPPSLPPRQALVGGQKHHCPKSINALDDDREWNEDMLKLIADPGKGGGGRGSRRRPDPCEDDCCRSNKAQRLGSGDEMPAVAASAGGGGGGGGGVSAVQPVVPSTTHTADAKLGPVCALYLCTTDQLQCRFGVKNEEKESNQTLAFVQANGYVEYKARYKMKRGQRYGHFHIAFLDPEECIYPFMHVPEQPPPVSTSAAAKQHCHHHEALLQKSHMDFKTLYRLEITVRLFQSFRGTFPVKLAQFGPGDAYHPLHICQWQDATLLRGENAAFSRTSVVPDPDGEHLKYVVTDAEQLQMLTTREGVSFPCPVPQHPEYFNDIGMLRMQVGIKFFNRHTGHYGTHRANATTEHEHTVWVKIKVVQQLSGKKRKFVNMLRAPSAEWHLPPHPVFTTVKASPKCVLRYALGSQALRGPQATELLLSIAADIARDDAADSNSGKTAFHTACETGNIGLMQLMLQHELSLLHKQDQEGATGLHMAAMNGHAKIVEALMQVGARLDAVTLRGKTAAELARMNGFNELGQFLARAQTMKVAGARGLTR